MKYLTNSEQSDWKECKRKWWLRHYRRLDKIRPDVKRPRDVGTIAHACLDAYYAGGFSKTAAWAKHAELVAELRAHLEDATETETKDINWIEGMVRVMLEGYFDWVEETGADAGLTVVAPEATLAVPLRGVEGVKLLGKIDLRVYDEGVGARAFFETKTVDKFADIEGWASINEQMLHYQLLEFLDLLDQESDEPASGGGIFNMIRRTKRTRQAKPPFYKRTPVWHSRDVLRSYWTRVAAVAQEIREAEMKLDDGWDHMRVCYPTPSKTCTWKCDYFRVCYMFDDPGSDPEGMVAAKFKGHDPLARYAEALQPDRMEGTEEEEVS